MGKGENPAYFGALTARHTILYKCHSKFKWVPNVPECCEGLKGAVVMSYVLCPLIHLDLLKQ